MEEITERTVEWHPKNLRLLQIPNEGVEYAWVSEDYRQVHQLAWCKDFLQDAIFASLNKRRVEIYQFIYDPKTSPPVSTMTTRIMVMSYKDPDFKSKLLVNCRDFLHQIEDHLAMTPTEFEKCANPPMVYRRNGVYILSGNRRWLHAPPMISFYTLMIRVGLMHPVDQHFLETLRQIKDGLRRPYNWREDTYRRTRWVHHDNDRDLINRGWLGIERILEGDRKIFHHDIRKNYPAFDQQGQEYSTSRIHELCGLVGFAKGDTRYDFPYWHERR